MNIYRYNFIFWTNVKSIVFESSLIPYAIPNILFYLIFIYRIFPSIKLFPLLNKNYPNILHRTTVSKKLFSSDEI